MSQATVAGMSIAIQDWLMELGINPKQCTHVVIDLKPDSVPRVYAELIGSDEALKDIPAELAAQLIPTPSIYVLTTHTLAEMIREELRYEMGKALRQ